MAKMSSTPPADPLALAKRLPLLWRLQHSYLIGRHPDGTPYDTFEEAATALEAMAEREQAAQELITQIVLRDGNELPRDIYILTRKLFILLHPRNDTRPQAGIRDTEPQPGSEPHSCADPGCKRCEKLPGKYCADDECNCGAPGNHATLPQPGKEKL